MLTATQVAESTAGKGSQAFTVRDYKNSLRRYNIDPDTLTGGSLSLLPDDAPLVIGGKVQKTATTTNGTKFKINGGFGLTPAQRNILAGSMQPIDHSTQVWHKGDGILANGLRTVFNPYILPDMGLPNLKELAKGRLKDFHLEEASPRQISNQATWSKFRSYAPLAITAPAALFASTYHNSKYNELGQPLDTGARLREAWQALKWPDFHAATVTGDDDSKSDAVQAAFWKTENGNLKNWMDDFKKEVQPLYSGQGNLSIDVLDDKPGDGQLKVVGRIGDREVFKVDKTRDRVAYAPDDGIEGPTAIAEWMLQNTWGAFALDGTRTVRPGIKSFFLNKVRPAYWLTDLEKDVKSPFKDPGTNALQYMFDVNRAIENDYRGLKSGQRQSNFDLPPDSTTVTPRPNNPHFDVPSVGQMLEPP